MAGVEILATQEVATAFTFNFNGFFIWLGVSFGLFFIFGVIASLLHYDVRILDYMVIIGIIVGILIGVIVGVCDGTPTKYETQYKVTISDEVSMNKFLEHYEIVDQEGKIYTVREKDD